MKNLSLFILSCIFIVSYNPAYSQDGNYFLKHYSSHLSGTDNFNWSVKQGKDGVMYFANVRGIISYDGIQWKLTKTLSAPFALTIDDRSGRIYVGFKNDFGYFTNDEKGHLNYTSIPTKDSAIGEIASICITKDYVYFCNEKNIFQVNIINNKVIKSWQAKDELYTGFATLGNLFLINLQKSGLYKLQENKFLQIKNSLLLSECEILFGINLSDSLTLLGTSNDELYLFDELHLKKFSTEAGQYIKNNLLSDGITLSKDHIALATLAGGCVIINANTGKIISIINYQTGLPDNEVYALGKDKTGGLWLSHEYGFTRADNSLPFKEYSSYPGLDGHLISVLFYNETLYVSTSEGVYYLAKIKRPSLLSQNNLSKENLNNTLKADSNNVSNLNINKSQPHSKNKPAKHLFYNITHKRKLLSHSDNTKEDVLANHYDNKKENENTSVNRPHFIEGFVYKKIPGVFGKCRQLIPYNNRILVSSNSGLYEITGFQGKTIIKESYINCIYQTRNSRQFYIGLRNGILSMEMIKGKWHIEKAFTEHLYVYSISEDYQNNLWIGSNGKIIRFGLGKNEKVLPKNPSTYYLEESLNENIVVRNINRLPTFFLTHGVFYYSSFKDKIYKEPHINKNIDHIYKFSYCQENVTWLRSDSNWTGLDYSNSSKNITNPYLSLFKNIQNLYIDPSENIWIIEGYTSLYRLNHKNGIADDKFHIDIREVKNSKGYNLPLSDLNLEYNNNSLKFFLAAPFYIDEHLVHYQHHLEGIMEEWSSWSNDHKIEFPFLPTGEYVLHTRAKNVLGQTSNIKSFKFKILPPYWKTTWFFIIEIFLFCSLIIVSIILNRNNQSSFFTKALTFLTLIIVVEFIVYHLESAINVGNMESPLIRLGFNVMLALLISPIEKLLGIAISRRKRRLIRLMLFWRKNLTLHK